jgi:hypothetical protein
MWAWTLIAVLTTLSVASNPKPQTVTSVKVDRTEAPAPAPASAGATAAAPTDDEMFAVVAPAAARITWDSLDRSEQADMCSARELFGDEFVETNVRSGMTSSSTVEQDLLIAAFFDILNREC